MEQLSLGLWTIGQLAERAGVSTSAVRYYERRDLLQPATRVAGQRRYHPSTLRRLTAILMCQQAGFSLAEIATMIEAPSEQRAALARTKLEQLDDTMERLRDAQDWVRGILSCGCSSLDGCDAMTHLDPLAFEHARRPGS